MDGQKVAELGKAIGGGTGPEDPEKLLARATAEVNAALGSIVSLMLGSEAHQLLFLQDLKWSLVPALAHRQFRLFRVKGMPCGYLTWARVSEEVERRLLSGQMKLQPGEWVSGDRPWIMDILLPPNLPEALVPMITEPFDDPASVRILAQGEDGGLGVEDLQNYLKMISR